MDYEGLSDMAWLCVQAAVEVDNHRLERSRGFEHTGTLVRVLDQYRSQLQGVPHSVEPGLVVILSDFLKKGMGYDAIRYVADLEPGLARFSDRLKGVGKAERESLDETVALLCRLSDCYSGEAAEKLPKYKASVWAAALTSSF